MTPNHNTIAVTKPTTEHRYRSPYDEEAFHPHRITGLTNISKIN